MLTVTIFDADGHPISESVTDPALASEAEIGEMIRMIDAGSPAWLAAQIVSCRAGAVTNGERA